MVDVNRVQTETGAEKVIHLGLHKRREGRLEVSLDFRRILVSVSVPLLS